MNWSGRKTVLVLLSGIALLAVNQTALRKNLFFEVLEYTTNATIPSTSAALNVSDTSISSFRGNINHSESIRNTTKAVAPFSSSITTNNTSNSTAIPLIIELTGQLGNHLCHYAAARSIQLFARDRFGLELELKVWTRNPSTKWKYTHPKVQQCFPNIQALPKDDSVTKPTDPRLFLSTTIHEELFQKFLDLGFLPLDNTTNATTENNLNRTTIPYLWTDVMTKFSGVYEDYVPQVIDFLKFDSERCCDPNSNATIDSNTTIVHLRGFEKEMKPKNAQRRGYLELSTQELIQQVLLGPQSLLQLAPNATVYTVSRFPMTNMVQELQEAGFRAQRLGGNTPTYDFCHVVMAPGRLVGHAKSTFYVWAATLSTTARQIWMYQLQRNLKPDSFFYEGRPFGPPRDHFQFVILSNEELHKNDTIVARNNESSPTG